MKKATLLILITSLSAISTLCFAQSQGFHDPKAVQLGSQQGGFSGPNIALTTVEKAKAMSDDTWVVLQGNIEQKISNDTYLFRDATGSMTVEIDHKRWQGQTISPSDKVQIEGKIDKEWRSVEVDVKRIQKLP